MCYDLWENVKENKIHFRFFNPIQLNHKDRRISKKWVPLLHCTLGRQYQKLQQKKVSVQSPVVQPVFTWKGQRGFNPRKKSTSRPTSCGLASWPSWTAHKLGFPRGLEALADVQKKQMPRSFKESRYLLFRKSFPLSNCRSLCRQLPLLSVLSHLSFHSSGHASALGAVVPPHLRKPQLPAQSQRMIGWRELRFHAAMW